MIMVRTWISDCFWCFVGRLTVTVLCIPSRSRLCIIVTSGDFFDIFVFSFDLLSFYHLLGTSSSHSLLLGHGRELHTLIGFLSTRVMQLKFKWESLVGGKLIVDLRSRMCRQYYLHEFESRR